MSTEEDKTFTQAEVDKIIADRLKRAEAKFADYDDLRAKAAKLDETLAAGKTDAEKMAARIEAAEAAASAAEAKAAAVEKDALKLRVAADKGLTPAQAKRLVGDTVDELEADADDLLASFPAKKDDAKTDDARTAATQSRRPAEDLRGGSSGGDDKPVEMDPAKLAESVPRR